MSGSKIYKEIGPECPGLFFVGHLASGRESFRWPGNYNVPGYKPPST